MMIELLYLAIGLLAGLLISVKQVQLTQLEMSREDINTLTHVILQVVKHEIEDQLAESEISTNQPVERPTHGS